MLVKLQDNFNLHVFSGNKTLHCLTMKTIHTFKINSSNNELFKMLSIIFINNRQIKILL
jgi:hypothetical protein